MNPYHMVREIVAGDEGELPRVVASVAPVAVQPPPLAFLAAVRPALAALHVAALAAA